MSPMDRKTDKSRSAFQRAQRVLVGGVNSPVRAFAAVGGLPPVIAEATGAYVTDLDGNRYIDYVGGYGPAILGHAHPAVVQAIAEAIGRGTCPGAPTEAETLLAEQICAAFPSVEKLRLTSSGTEAVMSAVRLARGATGRRQHRQVHRLLPRPRRRPAGLRRQRGGHAGHTEFGRRAHGRRGRHAGGTLQRPGGHGAGVRPVPRGDRRGAHRARGGQHGRRAAGPGVSAGPAQAVRPVRGAADLR